MTLKNKALLILFFLLIVFFFGRFYLNNGTKTKTTNYNFGEYRLLCQTTFINSIRNGKSICYDSTGTLFLEETYKNDLRNGQFIRYFPNGKIYRKGTHRNDKSIKDWTEFYENGKKKIYKYYDPLTYKSIYQKNYDKSGYPNDVILPIKITLDKDTVEIGDNIEISFELLHSEFNSIILNSYLDFDHDLETWEDTIIAFQPKFSYQIKTTKKGLNFVQGDFHEFDSILTWGGAYPFEFEYFVE